MKTLHPWENTFPGLHKQEEMKAEPGAAEPWAAGAAGAPCRGAGPTAWGKKPRFGGVFAQRRPAQAHRVALLALGLNHEMGGGE